MNNHRIRKLVAALVAVFVAFGIVLGATACGQSEEKVIEGRISAELDQIKDISEENIKEVLGDSGYSQLQASGLDPAEFYKALFSKFEYESKGVSVDGDKATATLDVTNIDLQTATQNYMSAVSDWATSQEAIDIYTREGEEGLTKRVVELLMESLVDPELGTKTEEVQITLVKNDEGAWEIEDENQVMSALFANTDMENLF